LLEEEVSLHHRTFVGFWQTRIATEESAVRTRENETDGLGSMANLLISISGQSTLSGVHLLA
jgi:hypothetical protein